MSCHGCTGCDHLPSDDRTCPHCGSDRLFGPSFIVDDTGQEHRYFDCARCHTLLLEDRVTGELIARAGAW